MQRAMKASRLVPGGSYTYSTSSLKLSQGGPHLQSNLTTKAKYSTTSNQIREMQTGTFAQAGNGKAVLPIVTRRGSFTDVAMAGKEWLIYMKGNPGVTHSFPLSTLPKTLQLNIIIAFYKCGIHAILHCWYSGIQKQGIRGDMRNIVTAFSTTLSLWMSAQVPLSWRPPQLCELMKISLEVIQVSWTHAGPQMELAYFLTYT